MITILITLCIVIVALIVIVCIVAGIAEIVSRSLHPRGYESSPQEVCIQLQKILEGGAWAFDDFTSVSPLKDARLEAIRQRCAGLPEEFPPESKGQNFGPKGAEVIRGFIQQLQNEAP